MILKAAQFAARAHNDQRRKYIGESYVNHVGRVAGQVASYPYFDRLLNNCTYYINWNKRYSKESIVCAAYLHDTVEDTEITIADIDQAFDSEISELVCWLTNFSQGMKLPRQERKKIDREHLKDAPSCVKLIKMFDRIDNLKDFLISDELTGNKFCNLYGKESELLFPCINVDQQLYDYGMLLSNLTIKKGIG